MIKDLDDTVKELLVQKMPLDPNDVDIKFEMPAAEWAAGISRPTINLFLYDVRENHELRNSQRTVTRTGDDASVRRPPVKLDISYLITAWTAEVADEHWLLGRLLLTLFRYPFLPEDVLKGTMRDQPPLQAWVAQPERTPNSWDFWSSLDGRLKAGISYMVTVAIEPYPAETHKVVTEKVFIMHEIGQ